MKISTLHELFLESDGISTDTRKIKNNTIFFALKGGNFDGNSYADEALSKGASHAVIDDPNYKTSEKHILVKDVLETLQHLATYHREYLDTPIIALTGSNGKTTTKELIASVLSSSFNTKATKGNLNNHIGVPLTLLSMNKQTEIGVVEMGANHQGEIAALSDIAKPNYGYITNIGKAHLEGFGGIEGVLKGKTELYKHLKKHNKQIFLNIDDPKLVNAAAGIKTYRFSKNEDSDVQIKFEKAAPNVVVSYDQQEIQSNLVGSYNFTNIAAAIAIGNYFKINPAKIKTAIESYTPTNNRSQVIERDNYTIILDAYNANPTSMEAAIYNFEQFEGGTKVVFLGDMFELGVEAEIEHQRIADLITNTATDKIYLIGSNFFKTKGTDTRVQRLENFEDLAHQLDIPNSNTQILIKGSRGMKLERILDLL
ncbi:UDP-N-acetylmuramoyl-tripeptide--D-alanyl-D-alanine ligase [Aquimarina spongiae]|uniref:UDP-N-acetylmuramoyl-tripeptide--D-alanyl-D-alanine ligase n=1 Tax=Aquimarina spongiae TaxID=570521 RepID=A0A1M6H1T1_9FLAO|nr:UDP-N-acetylmuramoyl-tripeptide--D-alanyl-D-alanine ligase [Aquimarina spongiae]SHJ16168.1 UDP-N-acetylmuramoyl-tripeptide--D-alanyl-D-alanine ligase [Aquimarina spongiae]